MQMYRHPEHRDVLENRNELRGVEQLVGDIRKDLKAPEAELLDTAIHLGNRSLTVSKTNAAQPDKFAWITIDDPRQIIVDAFGPFVRLRPVEHTGSERNAVTQYRDIDLHVFHVAKL